jgi:hypothetical protein
MTTSETAERKKEKKKENITEDEVKIKRILVPLDGSNCSFRDASKNELLCHKW